METTGNHKVQLQVQQDLLVREATTSPIKALAELIWNSLDADATTVDVRYEHGEMGMTAIIVTDNGHGIPYDDVDELFRRYGGSWKKHAGRSKRLDRALHGSEGRGRLKALSLGQATDWTVVYDGASGRQTYTISIRGSNLREARISTPQPAPASTATGVTVQVTDLKRHFRSLEGPDVAQELAETFALYLTDYRDITLTVDGQHVDPATVIADRVTRGLVGTIYDKDVWPVELEIVEWQGPARRALYLCDESGVPLSEISTHFHQVGDYQFSAYIKSDLIRKLEVSGKLGLGELEPAIKQTVEEARDAIKAHFRRRQAERAKDVVAAWKRDDVYPYKGAPTSPLEEAERKVFEIVAFSASNHLPDFESAPLSQRKFQLRMLRTAIETSPRELQLIMNEVLGLPRHELQGLAELLEETSLSAIISATKTVTDRLKFLEGLEAILFDEPMKSHLRERTQLHKILNDAAWIFGEEYHLSATDVGLTKVLIKHRQILGEPAHADEGPVGHVEKARGIIDLMLSRVLRRHRSDDTEHLVVELKAPKVPIGPKELEQIRNYALTVVRDERFRNRNVRWRFCAVSDEIDELVQAQVMDGKDDQGTIHSRDNVTIEVKTWAQILDDNKARLQFFGEKLQVEANQGAALEFLKTRYAQFLTGVVPDDESAEPRQPSAGSPDASTG